MVNGEKKLLVEDKMVHIVLATLPQYKKMGEVLTRANQEYRLLSFYLLKEIPDEALRYYVENGLVYPKDIKQRKRDFKSTAYIRERRISLSQRIQNYKGLENVGI